MSIGLECTTNKSCDSEENCWWAAVLVAVYSRFPNLCSTVQMLECTGGHDQYCHQLLCWLVWALSVASLLFTLYCSATPLVSHLFSSLLWYLLSFSDSLKLHVLGYFFWKHILGNWKTQTWTLWHLFIIKSYSIVKSWLGEYKSLNIHRHPVRFIA